MNLASPWRAPSKFLFRIAMVYRRLLPKRRCHAFGPSNTKERPRIERIYVINLNRETARWAEMEQELRHVLDCSGAELWSLTERYAAIDAKNFTQEPLKDADIDPIYTLGEQLFVEPQPLTLPNRLELTTPIRMSRPEIAVARSHVNVWRKVAGSKHEYALILEDDVWFQSDFSSHLDQAWGEIRTDGGGISNFDILYVSYLEVKHGAPKTFLSDNVYCPVRGLWHLSGYVLSREGAKRLLRLLPCRGPVDLWINHQFHVLDVRATRRSIISQRRDANSSNTYSILPALTKIGAISSEGASLFHGRPTRGPVFAFGPEGSGLTSLAMALSMLGYRCCSDLQALPRPELERLLAGKGDRIFDAYVNIRLLAEKVRELRERYPRAKFITTTGKARIEDASDLNVVGDLKGADVVFLDSEAPNKWQVVCEHLSCAPPACSFPNLTDLGQRHLLDGTVEACRVLGCKTPNPSLWRSYDDGVLADQKRAGQQSLEVPQSYFYQHTPGHNPLLVDHWIVRAGAGDTTEPAPKNEPAAVLQHNLNFETKYPEIFYTSSPKAESSVSWKIGTNASPQGWSQYKGRAPVKRGNYWIVRCEKPLIAGHNDVWTPTTMELYAALYRLAEARRLRAQ